MRASNDIVLNDKFKTVARISHFWWRFIFYMKIENTEKTPNIEWLFGGNPNAIEAQEKQGQEQLEKSMQLPKNLGYGQLAKDVYESLGFVVIGESKGDSLFLDVQMPEGWSKKATDHSMWTDLFDYSGSKRASIFYKAAFYDRDAFIRFANRYEVHSNYDKNEEGGLLKDGNKVMMSYCVFDNKEQKALFSVPKEFMNYDEEREARDKCKEYLEANFPDKDNVVAYW